MSEQAKLLATFKQELSSVERAEEVLSYSYAACQTIGIKAHYNAEEQVEFEALTSRFARLSDLLVQKIWRGLYLVELESDGTVRDRINKAEKKGLITSADDFIELRLLRNHIAHDYAVTELVEIYQQVLNKAPLLLDAVARLNAYVRRVNLLGIDI